MITRELEEYESKRHLGSHLLRCCALCGAKLEYQKGLDELHWSEAPDYRRPYHHRLDCDDHDICPCGGDTDGR